MTREPLDDLFPGVRFAHAVSLGGNCEVAHGLRVCNRHSVNGLFDWLVTPLDAIAEILADDGARLGTDLLIVNEGTSVRCGAYGVLYHHEFPRDDQNKVLFTKNAVENCRSKLVHKMSTFLELRDRGPVLFLRFGSKTDLAWDRFKNETLQADDVDALSAILRDRFPGLDFRLLLVLAGPEVPACLRAARDPRVAVVALPRESKGTWALANSSWRELLARIEFADSAIARNNTIDEALYWFGEETSGSDQLASSATLTEAAATDQRASLDQALRDQDDAAAIGIISAMVDAGIEPVDSAWRTGRDLWHSGRSALAVRIFAVVFERGFRNLPYLRDYLGLLTGEAHYEEVLRVIAVLRAEGIEAHHQLIARHLAMLSGHAKLSLAQPRDRVFRRALEREVSDSWLDTAALMETISTAVREERPFSFIRVGDGEARYLISSTHDESSPINVEEAQAMGDLCWENWFGETLSAAGDAPRTSLLAAYKLAIQRADVVGASTQGRLRADTGHFGYLAWQEDWLRGVLPDAGGPRWTDAYAHRHLNSASPFLTALLKDQDVLGVISPHPGLADALQRQLGIDRVIGYVVPAEGRLPTAAETRALGKHFPSIYEDLLATLSVPRPGCVFLVAAGLLGKIYCSHIKALGGIGLDIGALADAWMGFETRDGQNADVPALRTSSTPGEIARVSSLTTTYGCLSIGKTGSMALVDAIRNAGFPDAIHLHYLGPRAIELKRAYPEPMLDLAVATATRIDDANHSFRLVTSVRDPIARILSQAFYRSKDVLEAEGVDITRDRDAVIKWWDAHLMARSDLWTVWFDDSLKTTFGFDFRDHPFDQERKSVRFSSQNLRLLVLRQGDDRSSREAELGWLLERDRVNLRTINDAANQGYDAAYKKFVSDFVAPSSWLDEYYEADVIRHYYSQAERDAFRARWKARESYAASIPKPRSPRLACLSMMKTGSTALARALRAIGGSDVAHIHFLDPQSRRQKGRAAAQADAFAKHLEDPENRFAIVTCLRDPIARWISQAFENELEVLGQTGKSIVAHADAFIEWVDSKDTRKTEEAWFDDNLKATFGFDYRDHPFEFDRRSLRFSSDRLRLLILRQEDPAAIREAELGWLIERDSVAIPILNNNSARFADRYQHFVDTFVAPAAWLEAFYDAPVIRHFYTEAERTAFRARWSRPHRLATSDDARESGTDKQTSQAYSAPAAFMPSVVDSSAAATELETLKGRFRAGYAVEFNDCAYRPRERDWSRSAGAAVLQKQFNAANDDYAVMLEFFGKFDDRFRGIPVLAHVELPYWENWWLPGLDAVALYGLVAKEHPRVFMEIGSGQSTRFVRQSICDNNLNSKIISIDANPTAQIAALCDEVVRSPIQDLSISEFDRLQAGDILFIDGSHRCFQNSDATIFFTEILPALAPGVIYGLHDIFLPFDYPDSWTNRFYNEQYLLMAYLIGGACGDQIIFPAHHVSRHPAFAPLRNRLFVGTKHLDWLVSSFWMRRAASS